MKKSIFIRRILLFFTVVIFNHATFAKYNIATTATLQCLESLIPELGQSSNYIMMPDSPSSNKKESSFNLFLKGRGSQNEALVVTKNLAGDFEIKNVNRCGLSSDEIWTLVSNFGLSSDGSANNCRFTKGFSAIIDGKPVGQCFKFDSAPKDSFSPDVIKHVKKMIHSSIAESLNNEFERMVKSTEPQSISSQTSLKARIQTTLNKCKNIDGVELAFIADLENLVKTEGQAPDRTAPSRAFR